MSNTQPESQSDSKSTERAEGDRDYAEYLIFHFGEHSSDLCLAKQYDGQKCSYLLGHEGPCSWEGKDE